MSGTPPVFSTDVLRIFGEEYDADNDSDHEEDLLLRGPPGEYLEEAWHAVAVDAVCVHIRGEAEVNISVRSHCWLKPFWPKTMAPGLSSSLENHGT